MKKLQEQNSSAPVHAFLKRPIFTWSISRSNIRAHCTMCDMSPIALIIQGPRDRGSMNESAMANEGDITSIGLDSGLLLCVYRVEHQFGSAIS